MPDHTVSQTGIPGLYVVEARTHEDLRGSFTEVWHDEEVLEGGVPAFRPVQQNRSINRERGVTRGIHAEPWTKYVSLSYGRVFCVVVDLRPESPTFKRWESFDMRWDESPARALYLSEGLGNSFQTLSDDAVYSYLVTAHWDDALLPRYVQVNVGDPELAIPWPIPFEEMILSEKDRALPTVRERLGR
jgi:dTDP-4-dehydrorhamnose 3,5-epimerase/reductase